MAIKSIRNLGKVWTKDDVKQLEELAGDGTPVRIIGLKLGRTGRAIRAKARREGVRLPKFTLSPYGGKN